MESQPFICRAVEVNDDPGVDQAGKQAQHEVVLDLHPNSVDNKRPDKRYDVVLVYASVEEEEPQDRDLSRYQILEDDDAIPRDSP